MRGLSLVAASGDHSSSRCAGLSPSRPLLLRSTGSRRAGSVTVAHGPSCSVACGIFPDQGTNPCPLHWQADSQPLRHQGSPSLRLLKRHCPLYYTTSRFDLEFAVILIVAIFFNLFIYFILFLAVLGLRFCARAPSSCGERGPLFITLCGPLTIAASLVEEHRLQTRRLSSCGSWAQSLRGMWDPPRPGLKPVSPALAGRLSTTVPPGKHDSCYFNRKLVFAFL